MDDAFAEFFEDALVQAFKLLPAVECKNFAASGMGIQPICIPSDRSRFEVATRTRKTDCVSLLRSDTPELRNTQRPCKNCLICGVKQMTKFYRHLLHSPRKFGEALMQGQIDGVRMYERRGAWLIIAIRSDLASKRDNQK